jgi:hypothetical protein
MRVNAAPGKAPTVQQIILEAHKNFIQDLASLLAISAFIGAVLIWAS